MNGLSSFILAKDVGVQRSFSVIHESNTPELCIIYSNVSDEDFLIFRNLSLIEQVVGLSLYGLRTTTFADSHSPGQHLCNTVITLSSLNSSYIQREKVTE
jgi:hypothetical protein